MDVKEQIKRLPGNCGVYIMKDAADKILYIGKASNIRKRVSSYFYRNTAPSSRARMLASNIKKIDCISATCEAEALLLESSLIKRHRPKYNIELKDDKSYPSLKLTLAEKYPRIFITRKIKNDGSVYFGPYTNVKLLRQALCMIRRIFPLRTCDKLPGRVCLNYHLGQCAGPCAGGIDKPEYDEIVKDLILFLEGKKDILLKELSGRMKSFSDKRRFEAAARIRDTIEALSAVVKGKVGFKFADISEELKHVLRLKKTPVTIEAFDVSNLYGDEAVGSMVSFKNMRFDRSSYRKFRIRTVKGIDDYRMMREIISRRYRRVSEEKSEPPELIVIDGGKGHLSAAKDELDALGFSEIPVIGIAKEFEHIYLPDEKEPIKLPGNSGILHLIQRMRDEAHRFAVSYHRRLRGKISTHSQLDRIKGIGNKRKRDLIRYFGSVENIEKAGMNELLEVKGINKKAAKSVIRHFGKGKR